MLLSNLQLQQKTTGTETRFAVNSTTANLLLVWVVITKTEVQKDFLETGSKQSADSKQLLHLISQSAKQRYLKQQELMGSALNRLVISTT